MGEPQACAMISPEGFAIVYDLRDEGAWQAARRHRASWSRPYIDIHALGYDHIALGFRPAPDEGWKSWELVPLSWILGEDLEGRAA